ncbi:hypothetical protein HH310_00910 [Actinoplanes sp. TBRC 11911]|uniref:hypothetical protein n=1 Tax=Actinoplanes sp. TBRC 11911 TaxID=2729386 RepID=UPI00145D06FE|nr:hypothetical protein [Actinoplanes sp. TBRC 11911]NMO49760.1 hypothetical protein [Actinoplanes sp. TBRC 11911]
MRRWLRAGLILLIVMEAVVGFWQYEFDIAGLGLGFVVALLFAAVSLDHRLLIASLTAFAAYAGVHFVYQVLHFDQARAMTAALLFEVLLAIGLLALAGRVRRPASRRNVAFYVLGDDPRVAAVTSRNHRV